MNACLNDPTATVVEQHEGLLRSLPFDDRDDVEAADRGFLGALEPAVVRTDAGRVVWDNDAYGFLRGDAPDTVNPSLWRQSTLLTRQGLYEVVEGIYQVRGLDLSNVTFVEGDSGVIVIDPLISKETAAAALALYREHRGVRPVTAVIYTHSHIDHFGGVKGVTTQEDVDAGRVAILAPAGFVGHAVAENVYAGTAMARRAGYMYGAVLDRGPRGQVGAGLGQTTSAGEPTLIPPTIEITTTGQTETVDGVTMEFQMAPGTEAPAEMHFFFPDFNALCMAENATHNLHNLLTLRGALVRDPHMWAHTPAEAGRRYLDFMGGADAVVEKARASFDDGDYRWVAEVVNHVIQVDPDHAAARELLADTYEQLGYGAENGTWRSIYLSSTTELRHGNFGTPLTTAAPDLNVQLTPEQLLDSLAIRVDGPRCWDEQLSLDIDLIDRGRHRVTLRNGVLVHTSAPQSAGPDATLTVSRPELVRVVAGQTALDDLAAAGIELRGDTSVPDRLFATFEAPDPDFPHPHIRRPVPGVHPLMDIDTVGTASASSGAPHRGATV